MMLCLNRARRPTASRLTGTKPPEGRKIVRGGPIPAFAASLLLVSLQSDDAVVAELQVVRR
jgi:hypothetical protein